MSPRIPIRNLYYLLCYAWDSLEALELVPAGVSVADRPVDLFAKVLAESVARLLRQGLDRQYVEHRDDLSLIRGKIELAETTKRMLQTKRRACCTFTELDHDVLHNQIVKATLARLVEDREIASEIRREIHDLHQRLATISDRIVSAGDFSRVHLHRNNRIYGFVLHLCELVHRYWLPDPATGRRRFHDFRGDEREMGGVFESFVRSFLRREQRTFRVGRDSLAWSPAPDAHAARWLPGMQTDVSLRSGLHFVVMETKCVGSPLQTRFGRSTLRSDHLYQLFAYLKNGAAEHPSLPPPIGVLLYAGTGEHVSVDVPIHEHEVLVRTLDLDQDWTGIRDDLLRIVAELADRLQHARPIPPTPPKSVDRRLDPLPVL